MAPVLPNFIDNVPMPSAGVLKIAKLDPARPSELLCEVVVSTPDEIDAAMQAAHAAYLKWSKMTTKARVQPLFRLKQIMEDRCDELTESVVKEHGKNRTEARAEVMKGIETLEYATAMQLLQRGHVDMVSTGVQCRDKRAPLGVVASVVPFNFPCMVPCWTTWIAIALGNTVVLKPSEKVPLTMQLVAQMAQQAGLPSGVLNLVNGDASVVNGMIQHPLVKAFTFVGSSKVAELLSDKCHARRIRALCMGGAKNHLVVLPDCDVDMCAGDVCNSAFGSAGQRCMAASVLLLVGKQPEFLTALVERAKGLKCGQEGATEIGPVIDQAAVTRISQYIEDAVQRDGAELLVDGRKWAGPTEDGYWLGPTILLHKSAKDAAMREEIFGPVLSVFVCESVDEAIAIENASAYGNAAAVYTSSGKNALYCEERFTSAMIGVNIGIPVPREPFSFGGMGISKFGAHGDITGEGLIEALTQRIKVTTKWVPPRDASAVEQAFIR